ncbi:bifunctional phosphoribosylaminoimidazolecarboxamide formyltransferase/IMP cyclohydrolase [Gloeocapsa sp. PCC 73106]|uniref:bifunctional phosphoribosylaminoimidazolecarboxamide formyltransferase/IMP cyclohydrolase n=1 Tax=Gloeocapsa sp. PCC 73106 TaxID=102232 RepID=UPI0002AD181D|nr:bifunctional phosphoribosylaminoimidazolecarboxamide formyltransferase/IMP cyclohydrolase [Gloeocapsa sp. PCC 73106]ELR99970.1 phosphoribosylaminoimidazolecarboxamide formyltransferase/IMP cyclohydrolase [Gloeocapsa sp. PCC 73106]
MSRLALVSVWDKTGIIELAAKLVQDFDFELISSGGTAKILTEAGLPVIKVSDYTNSPEILGGRVKTLHPRIHGGILARRDLAEDLADLENYQIRPFDLIVVNLYPFAETIAQPGVTLAEAVEQIDIGGVALLRAAAKNFAYTTVLAQTSSYTEYLAELAQKQGNPSLIFRQSMAVAAFAHTQAYDQAIANYLANYNSGPDLPRDFSLRGQQIQGLRYGENPHQQASWYQSGTQPTGWSAAQQIQGKELSYNNLVDLEAARAIIAEFPPEVAPAVAILKHTNPCGVALGDTVHQAYTKAREADSVSAFGGIVAVNRPIDLETAQALTETFLECVVAPGCETAAQELLATKSNLRVLLLPTLAQGPAYSIKAIAGGFLVQTTDSVVDDPQTWQIVSQKHPDTEQVDELSFAWKVAKHVKSNSIVISKDNVTLGIGAGQMNRVGSVKIALEAAQTRATGAVLASDGFFPFDDSVRTAAAAGISAIIQPGGSIRDGDSIKAANELGLIMILTGMRHFLH